MWRCIIATIGELIIKLSASTATITGDFTKVKNLSFETATQIQRSFSVIGTAALGMLSTFGAAMAVMVDKTTEMQVHILHLAESAGTSAETMSGLAFASKMLGLDVDQAALAMERFDKKLQLAQQGNAAAGDIMKSLGIDPAKIKMSDDALMIIADRFAGMKDGAEKTGEAMNAFGKAGATMIPILNEGSAGLQKMFDTARALGLIFSKDDAEAALHFQQNLTILHGALLGFEITLEKAVLPNLNALTDALVATREETGQNGIAIDVLKFSFQAISSTIVLAIDAAKDFGNTVQTVAAQARLLWSGDEEGRKQAAVDGLNRAAKIEQETAARLNAIWGEGTKTAADYGKVLADATALDAKAEAAKKKLTTAIAEVTNEYKKNIATIGESQLEVKLWQLQQEGATAAVLDNIRALDQQLQHLQAKKTVLDQIAALEAPQREDEKRRFLADQLKADQDDLAVMLQQLDAAMKLDMSKFSPQAPDISGLSHTTQAFTDSITEQTNSLLHQIQTFGMSADAIARYDLAQLDAGSAAQQQIAQMKILQDQLGAMNKRVADVTAAWHTFGQVAYRSLDDLIFSGKKFTQVLADITKQLGEMFLKWALFGQSGSGGLFGSLFGSILGGLFGGVDPGVEGSAFVPLPDLTPIPHFASGGQVSPGVPILVGEKGPEIFMPSTAGAIVPNGSGAGGGSRVSVVYNIDARGADAGAERRLQKALQDAENRAVARALQTGRELSLRSA